MIHVACALIVKDGRVLCAQRGQGMRHPLKWEFPGGKIESAETASDCIRREILEELNLEIEVQIEGPAFPFSYPNQSPIALIPLVCKTIGGELKLQEHAQIQWLSKEELENLDWATADIAIVNWWKSQPE